MQYISWIFQSHDMFFFWLAYSIFCIPFVFLITWILPRRYNSTRYLNYIFFYILSVSIFIYGLIISCALIITLFFLKTFKKETISINLVDSPDYQYSPIRKAEIFGEGFGSIITKKNNLPKSTRQKMLIAINQFETSYVNHINSLVLKDDVDEVRLFAKSLIEKQEREISKVIKDIDNKIDNSEGEVELSQLKKLKALALWEQVYKHLINNENLILVIEKIKALAIEAMGVLPNDNELPLLIAKIFLKNKELEEASKWLIIAQKNHAPDYKIASYRAEINFLQKNYFLIKEEVNKKNVKGILGLQPITSFWVTHD